MRIGGSVFSVIRPFAPVVAEVVNGLGLGLATAFAGIGHRSTLCAGKRTALNTVIPIVRLGFGLAAGRVLTGAGMRIGHCVVHPIAEVAGVRSLIRSRRIKIYASLFVMGIVITSGVVAYILATFERTICPNDEAQLAVVIAQTQALHICSAVRIKVAPRLTKRKASFLANIKELQCFGVRIGFTIVYGISESKLNFKFAFYVFSATKRHLIQKGIGGGQPNISQDIIKQLWLPVPPLPEQQRIADFLDSECAKIDDVISKTKATVEEYKKLKQSVITKAVTKGIRPNREMKDSGIEWIGEIPREWEVVKMKHLGKCRNGLTYSPDNIVQKDEGTLVLRSSNIKNGKLTFSDNVYVDCEIKEELMVKANDILICSRNGSKALIGKNALIPENLKASFGAFMMIFRCDSPKYIQMILSSSVFSYYLGTFLTATINQLTADNFNNMHIVFCSQKSEQQEIADYLDRKCAEIDTLIAKKEQLTAELESYKKSLIYEYVTGKKEVK